MNNQGPLELGQIRHPFGAMIVALVQGVYAAYQERNPGSLVESIEVELLDVLENRRTDGQILDFALAREETTESEVLSQWSLRFQLWDNRDVHWRLVLFTSGRTTLEQL